MSAARHSSVYVGNTNIVRLDAVTDEDGSYVNDATVTIESVKDAQTGAAVSGISVPFTMTYVAASNGRYEAAISHTASFVAGRLYTADVLAIDSQARRGRWKETLIALDRIA